MVSYHYAKKYKKWSNGSRDIYQFEELSDLVGRELLGPKGREYATNHMVDFNLFPLSFSNFIAKTNKQNLKYMIFFISNSFISNSTRFFPKN